MKSHVAGDIKGGHFPLLAFPFHAEIMNQLDYITTVFLLGRPLQSLSDIVTVMVPRQNHNNR